MSTRLDVVIVSSDELTPDYTAANTKLDDRALWAAINKLGLKAQVVSWRDAEFDWSSTRLAVLRTPWDYHKHGVAFTQWVEKASQHTKIENDAAILLWNWNKTYLIELSKLGAPVIPSHLIARASAVSVVEETMKQQGWSKAVLKAVVGASGDDMVLLDVNTLAQDAQEISRLLESNDTLLQPFFGSIQTHGELSVIFINGEYSHSVRKIPAANEFKVQTGSRSAYTPTKNELATAQLIHDTAAVLVVKKFPEALELKTSAAQPFLFARVDLLWDTEANKQDDQKETPLVLGELELLDPELMLCTSEEGLRGAEKLAAAIAERVKMQS